MLRMVRPAWAILASLAIAACSRRPAADAVVADDAATTNAAELPAASSSASAAHRAAADAGTPPASGPFNVVLISVDSLRADMPWSGYPRPIAPRLSALHAKSVSYSHAYSTSSFTSKSVPGMLTGRLPSELARTGAFFTYYPVKGEFMCPALDAEGIPCIGGHAHAYFGKGKSGFEHGFREWKLVPGITFDYQTDPYVTSQKLTPLAIELLGAASSGPANGKPFFAWFHYMDPHDKYQRHEESPHFGSRARDLYDEEVFFTDLWIGKLLDYIEAQPWASRTAIVVTADHGEAFGEHGVTRHAHEVWEELVRVPLFVYLPGVKPRVIDTPRGHADLVPTFVDLLGASPIEGLRGTSLVPEVRGAPAAPRDVIVDLPEDDYNERRRALIHEKWKLIAFGNDVRFSLFDLEQDPREQSDLYRKEKEVAEQMRQRYKDASKAIRDVSPRGGIPKHDR